MNEGRRVLPARHSSLAPFLYWKLANCRSVRTQGFGETYEILRIHVNDAAAGLSMSAMRRNAMDTTSGRIRSKIPSALTFRAP